MMRVVCVVQHGLAPGSGAVPAPASTPSCRHRRPAMQLWSGRSRCGTSFMRALTMVQIFRAALVSLVFVGLPACIAKAESATPDDTARFLAGLQPAPGSALSALAQDRTWQAHAERFNAAFGRVEEHQLKHIRAWSHGKLTAPSPVLFYFFSGPDFLYANAFFPDATTYVLAGLEPPGPIPDVVDMPRGAVGSALHALAGSLGSLMSNSF